MKKIRVGILGATGSVGQRFIQLLENHPWFELTALAASEKSAGKNYSEAVSWKMATPIPQRVARLTVSNAEPKLPCDFVFSGLDSSVAGPIEEDFASHGYPVISNSKNHRMDPDVPLLIPEVNPDHLKMIEIQKKKRGYKKGFIVTNPNCSTIGLTLTLKPLVDSFGVTRVNVVTMQALSGAGFPGVSSMDIVDNLIPYIGDEETKMETEPNKILGGFRNQQLTFTDIKISAQCTRVAVLDGHTEAVSVKLNKKASLERVTEAFKSFTGLPQKLNLPSAPLHPITFFNQPDRPQPRLDRNLDKGMTVSVGRLRQCTNFDYKFIVLSHNTVRGAAGAAILNAELLYMKNYLRQKFVGHDQIRSPFWSGRSGVTGFGTV